RSTTRGGGSAGRDRAGGSAPAPRARQRTSAAATARRTSRTAARALCASGPPIEGAGQLPLRLASSLAPSRRPRTDPRSGAADRGDLHGFTLEGGGLPAEAPFYQGMPCVDQRGLGDGDCQLDRVRRHDDREDPIEAE